MAREAAGKGRCSCCGEVITWRRNEAGTLSYFCQDCDFQGYAKAGTLANKHALDEISRMSGGWNPARTTIPDEQKPAQPSTPPAEPKPAQPSTPPAAKKAAGLLLG